MGNEVSAVKITTSIFTSGNAAMDTGPRETARMDTASKEDPGMGILNKTLVEACHKAVLNDKLVDKTTVVDVFHASKVTKNIVTSGNAVVKAHYNPVMENTTIT